MPLELVLSLFSGVGALDHAFREAGWCVVSAGDVAWSSLFDVREFHPPAGVFAGVIGGDPCQSHSALANLVRAKGLEPSFPDMTGEYRRIVDEAQPRWFLRENTPQAPWIEPKGYAVSTFLLDHCRIDQGDGTSPEQMRRRRFWFGVKGSERVELRHQIPLAVDDGALFGTPCEKRSTATGRHHGEIGVTGGHAGNPPRYSLEEMLALQGLPADVFKWSPLTVQGKRKLVGNAVPMAMGRALANAVREAVGDAA